MTAHAPDAIAPLAVREHGDLVAFLLFLVGAAGIVAGVWNVPRFRETRELETRLEHAQEQVNSILRERQRYVRIADAFQRDPHYREGMIRQMSGERLPGEITVQEWLREARRSRRAEP